MTSTPSNRVLIAEDEPSIALSLSFILERAGFETVVEHDGLNVVKAAVERRPDAMILDAMLPGRDGYEILRLLRADPRTQALPVLMLTAKGQPENRAEALASGANRFLVKPYANAELVETIKTLTAG